MSYEALTACIERHAAEYHNMSDKIFDDPETGGKELHASKMLAEKLAALGFTVSMGVGGQPTAFRGEYAFGAPARGERMPTIGMLCEYDALADMGHGCAHHIQGPAVLLAAEALVKCPCDKPFRLVIYGTPDEEFGNGKAKMLKAGCFNELDVALMTHGGPNTTVDVKSMAECDYIAKFKGKAAHAAIRPQAGRSALDALLLSFQGVEFLREHVGDEIRMHYSITEAPKAANIVPERASGLFMLRAYDDLELKDVCERFKEVVRGAAIMSGVEYELSLENECMGKLPALRLNELLMQQAREIGAPQLGAPREKTGSTDFGCVTRTVPGASIRVALVPEGVSLHSQTVLDFGKSGEAHAAITIAAKVLARSITAMVDDESILVEIKREFAQRKNK